MKLNNAWTAALMDFQPEPKPKGQPHWAQVCMWFLAAIMLILLAVTTLQGIGG